MPRPDMSWLSAFLFVLGILSIAASVFAFFSGGSGFFIGLCGLAIAGIFFALGRALEYLQDIRKRLHRMEDKMARDATEHDDTTA